MILTAMAWLVVMVFTVRLAAALLANTYNPYRNDENGKSDP